MRPRIRLALIGRAPPSRRVGTFASLDASTYPNWVMRAIIQHATCNTQHATCLLTQYEPCLGSTSRELWVAYRVVPWAMASTLLLVIVMPWANVVGSPRQHGLIFVPCHALRTRLACHFGAGFLSIASVAASLFRQHDITRSLFLQRASFHQSLSPGR